MSRLLDEALTLDETGRRQWLETLAEQDHDLVPSLRAALLPDTTARAELEQLATLPKFGSTNMADIGEIPGTGLQAGDAVGPYRLVRWLGAGGMAEVWLAQRADGAFQRELALKLPLLAHLRRDLARRFALERDILASLEHIYIARLYDAGVSPGGLPYLAMEYVPGQSITAWCDARRLDIRARVELFLQVLEAVCYAHDKQVIHRDIKPSNILVTATAQVRLLDFGVAKLLSETPDDAQTQLTRLYGRAFTPDYASPETLRGEPATVASDIYSLGVLLYEMLSGARPFRLPAMASPAALAQSITQAPLQRPGARVLAEAAAHRSMSAKALTRYLRGGLDAITLKCLARDPLQRYDSAAALAADLRRHLAGEAVGAQPERLVPRAGRWFRRHRSEVLTGSCVALALTVGMVLLQLQRSQDTPSGEVFATLAAPERSIAVLPFEDLSEKKDQAYFSDGLAEELLDLFGRIPGLHVAARTSAFSFKGKADDIRTIGRKLLVANVLEGSVRRSGASMLVTVKLVRTDNGYTVWTQKFERKVDDIFKVQGEIASAVATNLKATLRTGVSFEPSGTQNKEAYFLYLRAKQSGLYGGNFKKTAALFRKVCEMDPGFAPAWAWFANMRSEEASTGTLKGPAPWEEARQAALKAIALDPQLPLAHDALAKIRMEYDYDWAGAQDELRTALVLDPSDYHTLHWSSILAEILGHFDESLDLRQRALAVDPLSPYSNGRLAFTDYKAGRIADAQAALDRTMSLVPDDLLFQLMMGGSLKMARGEYGAALADFTRIPREELGINGVVVANFALGRREASDRALANYERKYADTDAYGIAGAHAYRGEADAAIAWLDRAYRQHDVNLSDVKGDPEFRKIHGDARFLAFLRRMNLPT